MTTLLHYCPWSEHGADDVRCLCGARCSTWLPEGVKSASPYGPLPQELGYTFTKAEATCPECRQKLDSPK